LRPVMTAIPLMWPRFSATRMIATGTVEAISHCAWLETPNVARLLLAAAGAAIARWSAVGPLVNAELLPTGP